jgi:pyrrolysine biosynthesis protein PylD
MTRLAQDDIDRIASALDDYDTRLQRMTGASLRQIACKAAGIDESMIVDLLDRARFAAVPVSTGLGVIDGFSGTVAAIVSHLGFEAFATEGRDDAGIAEALERQATVLMLADDEEFIARAPTGAFLVNNCWATAQGFVAGLELMSGGIAGESVLVLGCGPVGRAAAKALIDRGANVVLCDIDPDRALATREEISQTSSSRIRVEASPSSALCRYELIFEATNAGDFIETDHLSPRSIVAAPGMPCALTREAMAEHRDRVLHDALEIGTATMAVAAAAKVSRRATADTEHGKKAEKVVE